MTFAGAQAEVDAPLDGLAYTPDAGFAGADAIAVTVNGAAALTVRAGASKLAEKPVFPSVFYRAKHVEFRAVLRNTS